MNTRKNSLAFFTLGFILLCCAPFRLLAEDVVGTLIQNTDLSCFTHPSCPDPDTMVPGAIGSPDPAGIAYLSEGPSMDRLLISDSEVNEMDWLFDNQDVNMFETMLTGDLLASSSTMAYSNEPTGVAFNPTNLHVFISDDVKRRIFEIDPGADGLFGTADDTVVASLKTRDFGSEDPEGIAYDYLEGALYVSDGVNAEVYKILPGPNGHFDGVPPDGDDVVTSFDTLSLGVDDPEGIEWDPATGHLYIVGKPRNRVAEVTTTGALVRMIDISAANPRKPAGLALGPWSGVGSDPHPDVLNLYIVDRGVDNNKDPYENDGKLYEFSVPGTPSGGGGDDTTAPTVSLTAPANGDTVSGTVTVSADASDNVGVAGVQFRLDGDNLGAEDTSSPYSVSWDTTTATDGNHSLTAVARDAAGNTRTSSTVTVTVNNSTGGGGGSSGSLDIRVSSSADDAEERVTDGKVNLTSSDLELTVDKANQTVGMRFNAITIPKDATITNAYVQFTVDETGSTATTLQIAGQAADNAPTFTTATGNISSRPKTGASVSWSPEAWPTVGAAGPDQRTPNIASVVQEIVNRAGWASGNSLAVIITGSGKRVAEAFNGVPAAAPLLHVEYTVNQPPA